MNEQKLHKLSKSEIVEVVSSKLADAEPMGGNWLQVAVTEKNCRVYHSQCKPSTASKGHWKYEFFNTLRFKTVEAICKESSCLVLLNYVHKVFAVLDGADLLWLARFSGRQKSNEGEVIDIVIVRDEEGDYKLIPYDKSRRESREVEVKSWIN
jgi:hypothetical protein